MQQDDGLAAPEGTTPELGHVAVSDEAMVLVLGDADGVRGAVERFNRGEPPQDLLGTILEYTYEHRGEGAELTPLYPERAVSVLHPSRGIPHDADGFQVAVPDLRSRRQELSAYHYLRVASPMHNDLFLQADLIAPPGLDHVVTEVFQPARPFLRDIAPGVNEEPSEASLLEDDPDWAIKQCGFPDAWKCLDQGHDPGPIGVIDEGPYIRHPALEGRVTEFPPERTPSDGIHASQVAAIIAARRDNGSGMNGCCSAQIYLYNVSTDRGFDPKAFYLALKAVARARLRVVNISMFAPKDRLVERQIEECLELGTVVVAAMGNSGKVERIYPAAYNGVIAVGATGKGKTRLNLSTMGDHICISAPGDEINTLSSPNTVGTANHSGTSYAAPMVSAAVWLALRSKPDLGVVGVRDLLERSTFKIKQPFNHVGHGRLDIGEMLRVLTGTPSCP